MKQQKPLRVGQTIFFLSPITGRLDRARILWIWENGKVTINQFTQGRVAVEIHRDQVLFPTHPTGKWISNTPAQLLKFTPAQSN